MDYATLRQQGIQLLERYNGGQWTDFNAHDPGITILEQLCYALTDLGYRTAYQIPDLLASGGGDPYASLHPPAAILTSYPVTPTDLRRLALDVRGVKNAWVETLDADTTALSYLPAKGELRLVTPELSAQPVALRGLYRVLVEASGTVDDPTVQANVAQRLHRSRGLCEDYAEITVLKAQPVQVDATVEVAPIDDPVALLLTIRQQLAEQIAPTVRFQTLAQLLDAGLAVDQIFEGPRLDQGFLTADVLNSATRRTVIHTSDLMRVIMTVPGVRAVSRIRISTGGAWDDWSQAIDADKVARLDAGNMKITLRRGGRVIAANVVLPDPAPAPLPPPADAGTLSPPPGRDRRVSSYTSVQKHLPMLYGIGETGLSDAATAERKAQAKQLKAYLMFFDQLLANSFSQLSHVKDLFSFDSPPQTYFAQAVDQPGIGLEEIRVLDDGHKTRLQNLLETPGDPAALERKNRFLNHLLARFGEPISDQALATSLAERAQQKQKLLADYPRCSSARGTGRDCLGDIPGSRSGLEERLRKLLALDASLGEHLCAVEHVQLRPLKEDVLFDAQGLPLAQDPPLLAVGQQDPFSLQLTFVLPDGAGRFARPEFKQRVEQTLRAETPAHLVPYVCWMDAAHWADFTQALKTWQQMYRQYQAARFSVKLDPPVAPCRPIELRGARDRLIDILGIGESYPLQDTDARAESLTVPYDTPVAIDIDPSQVRVQYDLYEGTSAVTPACSVIGTGAKVVLTGPTIITDHTYTIRATKLDLPSRQDVLLKTVTIRIGLNQTLPVSLPGLDASAPMTAYGSSIEVRIQGTQSGVSYTLFDDLTKNDITRAAVLGNGGQISVFTTPLLEDTVIRVGAQRDFDASEGRPSLHVVLDAVLPVAVRARLDLAVAVTGSPLIDVQGNGTITISGTQKSVVYSVYARPLLDADFVLTAASDGSTLSVPVSSTASVNIVQPQRPAVWQVQPGYALESSGAGTGDTLALTVGPVPEDSVVMIGAHKDHSVVPLKSDVQLMQAAAVLARPDPVPGLSLQLVPSTDGTSGSVLISGGQPGVFYHLRTPADDADLGRPAYFHKVDDSDPSQNKGLGQLFLENTFVIGRDPPPATPAAPDLAHQPPVAPLVDVAPLPQGTTVKVMAFKARTGVGWSASRSFALTTPPKPA
jgi:hypothetical protein